MSEILRPTVLAAALVLALHAPGWAADAAPASTNPALEAQVMAIATELRCLVCQNQTIADSHAELAVDLRREIRGMLEKGQSQREILDFMTQRYGDFVLYRPPVKSTTFLLWGGPALLLLGGVGALVMVLRRRQKLGAEAFDPDTPDTPDEQEAVSR
ncbi:uncharacterized protein involved in biosynthesis of c-type cytochromes [Burkholderiales bacterium JOSHI_001]|nr:uncharacterized protein involved in biosynthesis of c-type cytochromes [Burkholderiales bacterium JOSHI_001]